MFKEFKKFAMKGNLVDMAVAFVMGGAFGKIVTSFVNDIVMPPLGMLLGKVDFSKLFIDLSGPGARHPRRGQGGRCGDDQLRRVHQRPASIF